MVSGSVVVSYLVIALNFCASHTPASKQWCQTAVLTQYTAPARGKSVGWLTLNSIQCNSITFYFETEKYENKKWLQNYWFSSKPLPPYSLANTLQTTEYRDILEYYSTVLHFHPFSLWKHPMVPFAQKISSSEQILGWYGCQHWFDVWLVPYTWLALRTWYTSPHMHRAFFSSHSNGMQSVFDRLTRNMDFTSATLPLLGKCYPSDVRIISCYKSTYHLHRNYTVMLITWGRI